MLHVYDIAQILSNECATLEKRVASSLIEGKGLKLADNFLYYPNAVVSSMETQHKDVGNQSVGFAVLNKEIISEFEVLLRFDSNVNFNAMLNDEVNEKAKFNAEIIEKTISDIVTSLQARKIKLFKNDAFVNILDWYYVSQSNDGGGKIEIVYAISGNVSFKTDYNQQIYQDNNQGVFSLVDKIKLKAKS